MKRVIKKDVKTFCAASLAGLTLISGLAQAADNSPAINALLTQATYWHERSHDELAQESLQKILAVDENNADALYLLSLYALRSGKQADALKWRQRFSDVSPNDSRLQSLESASTLQTISPALLANVRQLSAQGNTARAIEGYRALFQGKPPIDSLAVEYYETLAGIPASRPQAIAGLRDRIAQQPRDISAKLALGRILSYEDSSRREGITLLTSLAASHKEADSALRQALLWMSPQPGDKALYDSFIQRHPTDSGVMQHFQQSVGGAEKGEGYTALNSGDTATARTRFENVLTVNPNDGDALAGLGYIAMRSGDFTTAENYLNQAVKQGGPNSSQWAALAKDAKFYGDLDKAKTAVSSGNIDSALELSAPLVQADGDKGAAASLFRADVLRRRGDLSGAEQTYRGVLGREADNVDAKLGLYYTLRQANKSTEAQQLLQTIPRDKRPPLSAGGVNVDPLRRQAGQALQANDPLRAMNLLQQALEKQPSNIWVKLDMARLLQKQGDSAQAQSLMASISPRGAPADNLYAAALFASETNRWASASQLLSSIPESRRNRAMRSLAARVRFNEQMTSAEQYIRQGNRNAALNTLRALAQTPPSAPSDIGNLAHNLQQLGDETTALELIRNNLRSGIKGTANEYAAQVGVLTQAGLTAEAEAILNNPSIAATTTPAELSRLRQGAVINQADELRERGQFAAAYDKLIVALQNDPQNADLMLAMARLYQSGKMDDQAAKVYDYVMVRDPNNQDARAGAINAALAQGDVSRARQLTAGLSGPRSVDRMILEARVAEAEGDHSQALALLRSAKGRVIGMNAGGGGNGAPVVGGLESADNPFINKSTPAQTARTASTYGTVLPWQRTDRPTALPLTGMSLAAVETPESRTLKQINDLLDQVQERTATWTQGAVAIRSRDGESGLSNLTEIKAPLELSGVPFDSARLKLSVTPVSLDSGSFSGTSSNRFGSGALQQARMVESATAAAEATAGATTSTTTTSTTVNADGTTSTTTTTTSSTTTDVAAINPSDYVADASGAQKASGAEVNLSLSGDSYKGDIGTTPLGEDLTSLVGGLQWSPSLSNFSKLIFTAERRAVTDSLLSYVGTLDRLSGKRWGQVTKNGGSIQYAYDDGDAGLYAGIGGYSYLGENVPGNTGITSSAGFYVRPYRDTNSEVKTGINVTFMDYSKNLSYYSLGQGGYFSPQNYISVSLPLDYTQKYDDWNLTVGGSVGYQSYSQDKSAFFPNNPDLQADMERMVARGYAESAYYDASSQNGVSYNVHANGSYQINPRMSIGGQVGYDTFGDYSESTAQVFFKYLLGGK
ncbi:cellulose synthase subunit BcsC-related outer membrane protein [Biostraticola tofi]|uniref:Tfp pilus assembly protein PilF n=1 Tax=Biostraticola tofi TaxID=466109 RepID=A0A4V6P459_9GAMM|nr:cellulose synthase subunit BcsC-related outer membrane protein [Biostraticola tofi]TCV95579.1 Tfp pilus assembly protein PilF [Biostraticola tofi]